MKIIFLPNIVSFKNAPMIADKIKNIWTLPIENTNSTKRCQKDGVFNQTVIGQKTGAVITNIHLEFVFHIECPINMSDIDAEKNHTCFGNGFNTGYEINGKRVSYIVLQEGQDLTKLQLDAIVFELKNPISI